MQVSYIDHMGSDLTVANAARVSFAKRSSLVGRKLQDKDARLIKYLASHNHWTPFGHAQATLHVRAPMFVARQLGKHQVGMVWNEVSRRYVDAPPSVFCPQWRERATDKKQGSAGGLPPKQSVLAHDVYQEATEHAVACYNDLLLLGVAPEQARMVLPQSTITEWYWTGSLAAWARVYKLRAAEDTQAETRQIAAQIGEIMEPLFPVSWGALTSL